MNTHNCIHYSVHYILHYNIHYDMQHNKHNIILIIMRNIILMKRGK